MNFQDFSSRIRAQASAAARSIPTFDDMAAKDEYIHSEEFNVRGQPRKKKSEAANNDEKPTKREPDETSSVGSWSLLDRTPIHMRSPTLALKSQETISTQGSMQGGNAESSAAVSADVSVSSTGHRSVRRTASQTSSASVSLLSAVADALRDQKEPSEEGEGKEISEDEDEKESVESDLSGEEDDPILAMVRESQSTNRPRLKKSKSKERTFKKNKANPKHRFMEEIEDPESYVESDIESLLPRTPQHSLNIETSNTGARSPGFQGPFGGFVLNMAKAQFDKVLKRSPTNEQSAGSQRTTRPPPLAREKTPKAKASLRPEDDYHRAASASFLEEDELAQLAKLNNSGGTFSCSAMIGVLNENKSYGFILFTLILAIFVYFYQQSTDDVT